VTRIIPGLLFLLVWSQAASAEQFENYVFGVAGPVFVPQSGFTRWSGTFLYAGRGIESRIGKTFAMGGEGGILSKSGYTTGMAAATPAFHFIPGNSPSRVDPFINGGVSILFDTNSVSIPIVHFGGGLNYSVNQRLGMRFEYRHHLWSPEADEWVFQCGSAAPNPFFESTPNEVTT